MRAAVAVGILSAFGCLNGCATLISSPFGPHGGTERVRPSESGGKLFCGSTPCESVEVNYTRASGHNGLIFGTTLLAEGLIGAGLTQDSSFNFDDPNTLTYVSVGLLTTAALDLVFWALDDDFWGGAITGASLNQPATVMIDGKRASLDVSDIVSYGSTDVPGHFSASAAIDRQVKAALEAQRQK